MRGRSLPQTHLRIVGIVEIPVRVQGDDGVQIELESEPAERRIRNVFHVADGDAHVVVSAACCRDALLHNPQVVDIVVHDLGVRSERGRAMRSVSAVIAVLAPRAGIRLRRCAAKKVYGLVCIGSVLVPALVATVHVLAILAQAHCDRHIGCGGGIDPVLDGIQAWHTVMLPDWAKTMSRKRNYQKSAECSGLGTQSQDESSHSVIGGRLKRLHICCHSAGMTGDIVFLHSYTQFDQEDAGSVSPAFGATRWYFDFIWRYLCQREDGTAA